MEEQIKIANNLDLLLVLGSGKSITNRCDHTYFIQTNIEREEYLDVVLSGKGKANVTEAESMKIYLTFLGLPEKHCYLEEQSLDTLGNMVFSQPIISQLLSGYNTKKIGLITDTSHSPRSEWLAKKVFGTKYEIHLLPSPQRTNMNNHFFEYATKKLSQLEIWMNNIETGNQKQFEEYIKNKHSMYANQENSTFQKIAIKALRKIRT